MASSTSEPNGRLHENIPVLAWNGQIVQGIRDCWLFDPNVPNRVGSEAITTSCIAFQNRASGRLFVRKVASC